MFDAIFKLLSGLVYSDVILTIILIVAVGTAWIMSRMHNRIRLAEYKHIATIYAMEKEFSNGFTSAYKEKLSELYTEHRWKIKGE